MSDDFTSSVTSDRPLVTIAIPTYNRANGYLPVALESALAQNYFPLEVIVSDNCSTDSTPVVVRSYADPRLRYIRHGVALRPNDNFNFCLQEAHGAYFLLLHDDDAIDTDFVTACLEAVNHRTDIGIIRTGARRIDGRGGVLGESPNRATGLPTHDFFFAWFDGRTALYMCNTLYNTDKLREIGGLQSRHNLFQDGLATCTLAARYGRVDVEDVKASFRIHAGELTGAAKVSNWCEDSLELLERMCEVVDDSHKEEVRSRGMRFFANVNYSRASKVKPLAQRITAFRHVFRVFGHRYFPSWRLVLAASTLYRGLRRIKRTALGLPQWAA